MDLYPQLTKLLTISQEIKEFENQKKVNYLEKEETMRKFVTNLKSMLNCKIQTEESRNFQLYFLEYLSDVISSSISFTNDKNEIENLIKAIKENKKINNNNNINVDRNINNNNSFVKNNNDEDLKEIKFDDIINKKSGNYEVRPDNNSDKDKFDDIEEKNIFKNLNEEKGFYPKNFKIDNKNINDRSKQNIEKNIRINNINDNNSNFNKINEIKNDPDSNDNEDKNNNDDDVFGDIENNIDFDNQINYKKIKNNNIINNNNPEDKKPNKKIKNNNINNINNINHRDDSIKNNNININNNIINNNLNNKYNNFEINNNNIKANNINNFDKNEIKKEKINEKNLKNERNEKNENKKNKPIKENNIIKNDENIKINEKEDSTECNFQSNNYSKEKINNIKKNENRKPLEEKKKKKKSKPKAQLPSEKYEIKINEYYSKLFSDNIAQFFIEIITDKDNQNNNFNNLVTKIFVLVENNIIEFIEQEYKEKIVTLVCILFYFCKGQRSKIKDYIFKSDLDIDQKLFEFLRKNILIPDNSKPIDFVKSKSDQFFDKFCKNLFLDNSDGKNDIFSAYSFLVISRCLRDCSNEKDKNFFNELLEKEYLITFKIKFILRNQQFYKDISDDFIEIYYGLHFIKIFYNEIFCGNNKEIRIMKDEKLGKYIFGKEKFILSFDKNYNFDINIDILFSELDNKIYEEVKTKFQHFYSINQFNSNDINDLIYFSSNKISNKEYNIILNMVEHVCEKRKYIYNNFEKYKNNLINLEKQILNLGQKTFKMEGNGKNIEKYSIKISQKIVFESLLEDINRYIDKQYLNKFELYPYGSITQFLGGNDSDIDIYLDIKKIKGKQDKINFLYHLNSIIKKITGKYVNPVISTRLCVIPFKYTCPNNGINCDFDISLMGFCPYLHSVLIRGYALMEPRFRLLAISLKNFIKLLEIKNDSKKLDYLNSFSWMILLITFLQDIIKPQILPKVLSNNNNSIKNAQIEYGQNTKKYRDFDRFVWSIKPENTFLPDTFFNKNLVKQIYKEQIEQKQKEKNNLTCAEIFLYFLEFIIYYFKNDSIYVNCSIENEGFESMYYILNNNDINQKNISDERFQEYFKFRYYKARNYNDNNKTRDGLILIRDPLDPHYNPGQTLRSGNYYNFMNRLKKGYLSLLQNGDFDNLKSIINDEKKGKNEN